MEFDAYNTLKDLEISIRRKDNKISELYKIIYEQREQLENCRSEDKFNYNIDKNTFIQCMNSIKEFNEYLDKLNDLNINLYENKTVAKLLENFTDLISFCVNDPLGNPYYYSDLAYFMYDLNWGKDWKPGSFTDGNNNDIKMSTLDEMWDYFIKENKKYKEDEYDK